MKYRVHYDKYDHQLRYWHPCFRDFRFLIIANLFIEYMRRSENHIFTRMETA